MWVFKEFSFAVASFHPSWSCSGFWLAYKRLALPSVLLVNVWDLAVSLSAYTSKNFSPWFWWEGRRGWALLVLAFFFTDYTENAVVLTSGLSVLLASNNAVLFWSAIRMHCETTGVWLKVVFSLMFGVVIVWRKIHLSDEGWVLRKFLQLLSIRVCDWSQVPFAVLLGKMLFVYSW